MQVHILVTENGQPVEFSLAAGAIRPLPPFFAYLQASVRKVVETTSSLLERLKLKSIHAVTARGFELKVAWFVPAVFINFLC